MDVTPVLFTANVLAYLALLGIARRGESSPVADALFWCWLAATAGVMINGGHSFIPLFIAIDTIAALYLVLRIQTRIARKVAFFFIPMTLLNAMAYYQSEPPQAWHYVALSTLSFVQVLVAIWGAWCGGFIEALDNLSRRIGVPLNRLGINKNKGAG